MRKMCRLHDGFVSWCFRCVKDGAVTQNGLRRFSFLRVIVIHQGLGLGLEDVSPLICEAAALLASLLGVETICATTRSKRWMADVGEFVSWLAVMVGRQLVKVLSGIKQTEMWCIFKTILSWPSDVRPWWKTTGPPLLRIHTNTLRFAGRDMFSLYDTRNHHDHNWIFNEKWIQERYN